MNWGIKVVIGLALFMIFILAMATKMFMVAGDDQLVEKDYYEKGLAYDKDYDLQKDAQLDSVIPDFIVSNSGVAINFIAPATYNLQCRRPSDIKLDQVKKGITGPGDSLFISREVLRSGPWNLHLEFRIKGKSYLVERQIVIP